MSGACRNSLGVNEIFLKLKDKVDNKPAWGVGCLFLFLLALSLLVMFNENTSLFMGTLFGLSAKSDVLEYLAFAGGGCLIILQIMIANRRARAMENTAIAQAKATERQAEANRNTEEGQRQERLKNAIEHLGHQSDSVRLGGAYELVHLAEDIEHFRRTVLDILCAHIRRTTGDDAYLQKHRDKPSEEVQSLLTLLFVQKIEVFKDLEATLTGSWLIGAYLSKTQLKGADLSKAALKGAHFWKAELQGAKFVIAQLQGADLSGAQLQGAKFGMARLQGVDLRGAQLQGAELQGAQLQGADLRGAQLQGGSLTGADLKGAHLWKAELQRADLSVAQLQGVFLTGAKLQGADLMGAQLQGAELSAAQLQGANLSAAQLQGVDAVKFSFTPFEERIRGRTNQNSCFSSAVFEGGLSEESVDNLVEGLDNEEANRLREGLTPHIGLPESFELREDRGAATGIYTEEEAARWIVEYQNAMRGTAGRWWATGTDPDQAETV